MEKADAAGEPEPTEASAIKLEAEQTPSYTEAKNEPPPTYEEATFQGKLHVLKAQSTGNVDYGRRVVNTFLCSTVCSFLWAIILLLIPLAMIIIGSIHIHNCPAERMIPIYLIVAGVFGVLKALANIGEWCYHRKRQTSEDEKKPVNPFDGCVNLFLFCWFIAGSVWVYRIHRSGRQGDFPNLDNYCNNTVYWFAFWIITIQYIFFVISILFCLCACCALTCFACAAPEKRADQENQP